MERWYKMFIYIGNELVLKSKNIIAIFEADLIQDSRRLMHIVREHEQNEKLFGQKAGAKSLVLTDEGIYCSPLSRLTLKNRDELYETTTD